MLQRLLAVLLVLVGLIGLSLGRLGETTWAPATEVTATVELNDPGPAVIIDPGVLYIGGMEGEVTITGAEGAELSLITAPNDDIAAYLEGIHHTRITGAEDWSTLSTQQVEPEGEQEIASPTTSDLWWTVETAPSPVPLDIAEFAAGETGENEQPYRALLIVADGTAPAVESVTITWPVEQKNEWVPYAYAAGATVAVIGLIWLVVSLSTGGRGSGSRKAAGRSAASSGAAAQGVERRTGAVPLRTEATSDSTDGAADSTDGAADSTDGAADSSARPDADSVRADDTEVLDAIDDTAPSAETKSTTETEPSADPAPPAENEPPAEAEASADVRAEETPEENR
jgi:hypothetical protein